MPTASNILTNALREIGAVDPEETPTDALMESSLDVLNSLLDSWSVEDLLLYYSQAETFPLVAGTNSYSIGDGGDFDTVRPIELLWARYRTTDGLSIPLSIISFDDYKTLVQQTTQQTTPSVVAYQPVFPLANIYIWPTPSSSLTLEIGSNRQFTQIADENLTTDIALPPGYRDALVMSLAERLCISWGRKNMLEEIKQRAIEAVAKIKRKNSHKNQTQLDSRFLTRRKGTYNPYSDQ